jgi:hypothetical protein
MLTWDSDEIGVFDAVIRVAYDGPEISHLVILGTTEPGAPWGVYPFHARKLGLPFDVRANYAIKNVTRFQVRQDMRLPHPYTLASASEIQAIYRNPDTNTAKQKELRQRIREGWGVITFSRVGFDVRHGHGVVYAQLTYCGLCGGGDYFYLSKENGTWHVVGRAVTWIS